MSQIVEPKTYQGKELETIFFRPMLTGKNANELGIRVLYNMPVPTILNFWKGASNVLRPFSAGWEGGAASQKFQKTIELHKVKSEMGYSAADYFTMVFEQIAAKPGVDLDDLSGTELEEAETKLFRDALAESLRATMWIGATERENGYFNTFNGILWQLLFDSNERTKQVKNTIFSDADMTEDNAGEELLKTVWNIAPLELKELKAEGNLAFFVTSDVYSMYEESLDRSTLEAAYIARQEGRPSLSYRGIPVIDMQVSGYLANDANDIPETWIVLADKRNLALAVNTADFPGTEVRMWYNPDEMQNRQRAVFAAGCDYLLPELICYGVKA
jgi:hypothetical protein